VNFGIPRVEVEGLPFPNAQRIRFGPPQGDTSPAKFAQNTYETRDSAIWVRGRWTHMFGIETSMGTGQQQLHRGRATRLLFVGLFNLANDTLSSKASWPIRAPAANRRCSVTSARIIGRVQPERLEDPAEPDFEPSACAMSTSSRSGKLAGR
jgi:hypothetical protein